MSAEYRAAVLRAAPLKAKERPLRLLRPGTWFRGTHPEHGETWVQVTMQLTYTHTGNGSKIIRLVGNDVHGGVSEIGHYPDHTVLSLTKRQGEAIGLVHLLDEDGSDG